MSRHLRSIRALITQYAAVLLVPLSMDGDLSNYKPVSLLAVGQAAQLHLRAYMPAHHVEAVDILETVNKLTLSAMTALQTGFGSPAWRAHTEHAQDVILAGLTRKLVKSISLLDQALHRHETEVYYALSNTQKHHIDMSIANATNLPLVFGKVIVDLLVVPPYSEISVRLFGTDLLFSTAGADSELSACSEHKEAKKPVDRRTVWQIIMDRAEVMFEIGNIMTRMDLTM